MLLRFLLVAALAAGLSSAAEAQLARVFVGCTIPTTLGTRDPVTLIVDENNKLCAAIPAATPSSASGAAITPATSTASSLVAKNSAGNLYGFGGTMGGTAGFLAVLNAVAAPSGGAAISPVECVPIAANASYRTRQDIPDRYGTGIVIVATSSCATYTAVTPVVIQAVAQ